MSGMHSSCKVFVFPVPYLSRYSVIELDPEGAVETRAQRFRRRTYRNAGPTKLDMTWYDKMKPNWLSHLRLHR